MLRSALAWTVVVAVAVFGVVGSGCVAVTLAELLRLPLVLAPTFTTIVTVALLPALIVPKLQLTVVDPVHAAPWLGVAETSVTPAGSGSLKATPVALFGPLFVTAAV